MEIKLRDETPFTARPYRMAPSEQETAKKIIDNLLECNIIRESNSEYASPMLLVNKKDRDARLCVNYQRLNKQTVKDSHPLPRIDDLMDRLAGGKVFISLDLKSGYYQIPLSEDSKKYTAFVTPGASLSGTRCLLV